MTRHDYETTPLRATNALFSGALVGGLIVVAADIPVASETYWRTQIIIFVAAFVVWSFGLWILAAPVWYELDHRGYRSWPYAVALGAMLTFVVTFGCAVGPTYFFASHPGDWSRDNLDYIVRDGRLTAYGFRSALVASGKIALAGAVVALVVWRVAYRRRAVAVTDRT